MGIGANQRAIGTRITRIAEASFLEFVRPAGGSDVIVAGDRWGDAAAKWLTKENASLGYRQVGANCYFQDPV